MRRFASIIIMACLMSPLLPGGWARAAHTTRCGRDGDVLRVGVETDPVEPSGRGSWFLFRKAGGRIFISSSPGFRDIRCARATVSNIDRVVVSGGLHDETFNILTTAGAFRPGKTSERRGKSEIEFRISLGQGDDEALISGPGDRFGPADIRFGTKGANVNADRDTDVRFNADVETIGYMSIRDTKDVASGRGGRGTGQPVQRSMLLRGASDDNVLEGGDGDDRVLGAGGDDVVIGGRGNDVLGALEPGVPDSGETGDDLLKGEKGSDYLRGEYGRDRLLGGRGHDEMLGLAGRDLLLGKLGNDSLSGGRGPDTLDGGDGLDTCDGGADDDVLRNCEG